ncbi:MAG: LacI family transcriptional regulator [Candidatus Didemnitutus sp.]|nr:LacI family transcriptional regulator [Candidatus Didemnitutus sp.]
MSYQVSMRDVARAAGVSVSAVSLALRNSPKISADRRDAVLKIAEELGYRRDPRITELMEHLRTARPQRASSTIAMIIPELTREQLAHYPPIQGLIEGAREIAAVAGFGLDVFHLTDPGMSPRRVRQILLARGVKGVLIAPCASGVARINFDCTGLCVATAGYSIIEPRLHRACPDYLQMMDELIADCTERGYHRVGLVMTYGEGGIGQKLFTSSFLYWQSKISSAERIPVLPKVQITPENLRRWFDRYRPEAIISAGSVFATLQEIGLRVPRDVAFASIDVSQSPTDAAGADHRYNLVGREALKQVLTMLNLNLTGVPESPKVVLVDSHRREGYTLPTKQAAAPLKPVRRARAAKKPEPAFRGFVD